MPSIFLNQAGTSWPKPASVLQAVNLLAQTDPVDWSRVYSESHDRVARYLHVDPTRLILTPGCTSALSLAISDHNWERTDRVLTSHFEHHALYRNLLQLKPRGVEVVVVPPSADELIDLDQLECELERGQVKLVAITAACNVTGRRLPIQEVTSLAHRFGTIVLIDGAQIAGWQDLDVSATGADLFTFAGHKALHAPWGIGGLYVSPDVVLNSPIASCEPELKDESTTCQRMPGYCDVGSANLFALAGLAAACDWLEEPQYAARLSYSNNLALEFSRRLDAEFDATLYHRADPAKSLPSVAFNIRGSSPAAIVEALRRFDVIAAGGFQCSPQTHLALGTHETGTVRVSFGPQNHRDEIDVLIEALHGREVSQLSG